MRSFHIFKNNFLALFGTKNNPSSLPPNEKPTETAITATEPLSPILVSKTPQNHSELEEIKPPQKRDKKELVNLDNALVNAAQNLLLSEKRIVTLAMIKLNNNKIRDKKHIRISAIEYAEIFKIEKNTAYEQIKSAADTLLKRQVHWYKKTEKSLHQVKTNWLSFAEYAPKEGFIEIKFTEDIEYHLTGLVKNFTTYRLEQTKVLRSIYSWRLLELLSQFKSTGWLEISLESFTNIIGATQKKSLCSYSYIHRKIIEPSVSELNEKSEYKIDWKSIKKGKKVIALHFSFEKIEKDIK